MIDFVDSFCYTRIMLKRPLYLNKIKPFINEVELVKIITGVRRSGKSVLLGLIQEKLHEMGVSPQQILSYNFEDFSFASLKTAQALHDHIKQEIEKVGHRCYLFLDEIQEVENWEGAINSLRVNSDVDIYVTGSNSRLLSSEFSTYLGGRYVSIQVYPLSFKEIVEGTRSSKSLREQFMDYLQTGGMPQVIRSHFDELSRKQYLEDLFSAIVVKDIVKRNRVRDVDMLERLIKYVIANMGKTFSASSISKFFKAEKRALSPDTAMNYLKYCEEAYLLMPISRYDVPSKRLLQIDDKFYLMDHGLRETIYGNNIRDIELTLENIVAVELKRRGYQLKIGRIGKKEIDFIAEKSDKKLYFQVCYLLETKETQEREFGVYQEIPDNFPKYVISMDDRDFEQDGVKHMKIWDFLMHDEI